MPISLDTSADLGNNGGGSGSLSAAYTNAGNILFIGFTGDNAADDISSVTYKGGIFTLVNKLQNIGERFIYLYALQNPFVGLGTITITSGVHYLAAIAASYNNAQIVDMSGTVTKGTVSALSGTVSASQKEDWTIGYANAVGGTLSAGASTTLRKASSAFPNLGFIDSNGTIGIIGNTALAVNDNTNSNIAMVIASLLPSQSGLIQSEI